MCQYVAQTYAAPPSAALYALFAAEGKRTARQKSFAVARVAVSAPFGAGGMHRHDESSGQAAVVRAQLSRFLLTTLAECIALCHANVVMGFVLAATPLPRARHILAACKCPGAV